MVNGHIKENKGSDFLLAQESPAESKASGEFTQKHGCG